MRRSPTRFGPGSLPALLDVHTRGRFARPSLPTSSSVVQTTSHRHALPKNSDFRPGRYFAGDSPLEMLSASRCVSRILRNSWGSGMGSPRIAARTA
jgi:hypothetical protein